VLQALLAVLVVLGKYRGTARRHLDRCRRRPQPCVGNRTDTIRRRWYELRVHTITMETAPLRRGFFMSECAPCSSHVVPSECDDAGRAKSDPRQQRGPTEDRPPEARPTEVRPAEVRLEEVRPAEVRADVRGLSPPSVP
jgi:hypothetical protein